MSTTRRVSVSSTGAQANYGGSTPGVSADGRYIAFFSNATNLVPGDTNGASDVFVYDRTTRQTVRVSVTPNGSEGFPPYPADFGGEGLRPAISANGRFVAFFSFLQLVPGDTNSITDIYVHDRDTDADGIFDESGAIDTVRVNVATDGTPASPYNSYYTDISADGRYVVFGSDANNLVPGDTNSTRDVFVHDRDTDGDGVFDEPGAIATRQMSVATDGTQGNQESTLPRISADGRYVSFIGGSTNLVSGDANGRWDVFVRDRDTDADGIMDEPGAVETFLASPMPAGGQFDVNVNYGHDISGNGYWVGFEVPSAPSGAVSMLLYAFNTQTRQSMFVRNLGSSSVMRTMAVSYDGSSIATNEGDAVVLVDRSTGSSEPVSVFSNGSPARGFSVALSDDARFVAFTSELALVPGDTNSQADVYVRDRNAPPLTVPGTPTNVVAVAGDHSATLSWNAPDDGGSPIQYSTVTTSPSDVAPFTVNAPNLDTTVSGLTPGKSYTFTVTATNAVGTGPGGTSNAVTPTGVQLFALSVSSQGSGSGTITTSPAGIDCGSTCSADFNDGTDVTLSALPDLGASFEGWSGAGCSGVDDCVVTVDAAKSVTATFEALPPLFPGFADDFSGSALDSSKWNTSIATTGVRWCPSTQANHLSVSGQWQDPGSVSCHAVFASPPHGSIAVSGGVATFSAPSRRTFPYVWRGEPSSTSPFPSTGAFVLELRMRFPSLTASGTELNVGDWPNSDPIGDNPPGNSVFSIGACGSCGLVANLLGTPLDVPGSASGFHDYRLEYVHGRYSVWVDGTRLAGPVESSRRPNTIWVGNPVITFWTFSDWTDIAMDSLTVLEQRYPLEVAKDANGGGLVTSDPAGVDCGATCQHDFNADTKVTLTATPNASSSFAGWSGSGCSGTGTCLLAMDQARSVTATFTKNRYVLNVTKAGSGAGSVTSSPAGIDCGQSCSATFDADTQVTLSAAPDSGSTFQGWSGDCLGSAANCTLTLSQARSASATFAALPQDPVWAWGDNGNGQLGNSTCTSPCPTPTQAGDVANVVAISAGGYHSLALRSNGTVWAWGFNGYGQLGNSTCTSTCPAPTQVGGLTNVVAVSAGDIHSLALRSDGTVWAWGNNWFGRLGNSTCNSPCPTPTQVGGLTNIVAVSAGGYHSLALRSDGTVWAWGHNGYGQLGNSTCNSPCPTPTQVGGLTNVVAISAGGNHSMTLRSDGRVWAWGNNGFGQLGPAGCSGSCPDPTQVSGLSDVDAIAAGRYSTLAIANSFTAPGETVTANVGIGDPPVTTDVEGDGATPTDPVETAVTSPQGGTVTIEDGPSDVAAPSGYSYFGEQVEITAPSATVADPIVIVLQLDASLIPTGQSADTLAVFRNGSYILPCTGTPGTADPDPCVSDRQTLPDGDAQITVLTSHASRWNLGFPAPIADAGGPYSVAEGSTVRLDATHSSGTAPLSFNWFPSISLDDPTLARPTFSGVDDDTEQLTLQVTDGTGQSASTQTTVTVTNAIPVVHVTGPGSIASGTTVALSASFTDAGRRDTHTASVNWGDGTTTTGAVTEANGSGTVAGSHRYVVPGTYAITVKVTDDDGGVAQASSASFSVTRVPVGIDVVPGDSKNTIQLSSKQVSVAVLSTSSFNATTQVDRNSLTFGRTGSEASLVITKGVPSCTTPDVNSDGRKDLSCTFTTSLTALRTTDTQAILRARRTDGVYLEGRDTVRVLK